MLKKCLLGLFVGFVGLIGFSNAKLILTVPGSDFSPSGYWNFNGKESVDLTPGDLKCAKPQSNGCSYYSPVDSVEGVSMTAGIYYCFDDYFAIDCPGVGVNFVTFTQPTWSDLSMSSSECEEEYNLIPISSVDTNYCVQNDLCPVSTGNCNNWSELMINNIVHEGKPLINISIPDNIYWDYATDENQFDLYVGSGYDQDYIDSVLAINSYRPDNEDFTTIFVSGLTLIFPYIFVALLIVFIWKLLKRIFK